jgi:Na+-translocating ferredoxin:NAD+ oxidoreductase subunit E
MTLDQDPRVLLFLGLCPAIAVAVRVIDALWMSAGIILVLVLSDLAMSLLAREGSRRQSGDSSGVTARGLLRALVITSSLTACFEAVLLARAPSASASLGIYGPLIAVNCLVLGQGLSGSPGPAVGASMTTALGKGMRFALALVLIAVVREVVGAGTVTLFPIGGFSGTVEIHRFVDQPVRALGFAGGGLLCLGYLAAAARAIASRVESRNARRESSR